MKKSMLRMITTRLAGSAAAVLLTMGVLGGSSALAQIAGGKHDLSIKFTPTTGGAAARETCVFCHTPHGADITDGRPPLWNRVNSGATYQSYQSLGSSSLDGATAAVGSISVACLSCHDGVQAMNTMINAPGSGLGGGAWAGTWSGTGVNGTGQMTGIANLGQDLRNDHPIGIQYGGGMSSGPLAAYQLNAMTGGTGGAFKDPDFRGVAYGTFNSIPAWWVETSPGGTATGAGRQKQDLPLYTRTGAGLAGAVSATGSAVALVGPQALVECASCHDPHASTATFLRMSNSGSAVCLACHIK